MFLLCGIAGVINYKGGCLYRNQYEHKVKNALGRRGPDQNGVYYSDEIILVHSRLCIVDIENGRQPMEIMFKGNKYCIVYNGELYNTQEIKDELISKGHEFCSYSDTEAVIRSYIEWGEGCLNRFNGIFAFAIWDENNKELFIARDKIGVKPLFFCQMQDMFVFGSEIKAVLAHPLVKGCIDKEGIKEVLLLGPGRTPGCGVFKGIDELKPGQYAVFNKDRLSVTNYWCVTDHEHTDNFLQTAEKLRYLLVDSIKRQMVSDVPICTFLSGGLDSSIITSIVSKEMQLKGEVLTAYSVDYSENQKYFRPNRFQPNSDDQYIGYMKDYVKLNHNKLVITPESLADALYEAVKARDLPGMADIDSSLLLFCREIKKKYTVALSGECADELFGGYPWFKDLENNNLQGFPWSKSIDYRKKFIKDDLLSEKEMDDYVKLRYIGSVNSTENKYNKTDKEFKMQELTKLNMDWFMQTLLDRKDRMSMFSGLEVRVPFCDYRIVEYAYCIPWEFKNYEGREKGLLRYVVKDILPREVLKRKKSPYPKIHNPIYLDLVRRTLMDIIEDASSPILEFISKRALEELINTDETIPWYGQLMDIPQIISYFVQINYWLKLYNIDILI